MGVQPGEFTHIFVDEVAQALEPELLIPLSLAGSETAVVLAGDPCQLGPTVRCPLAARQGLGISLQERLMRDFPQYDPNPPAPSTPKPKPEPEPEPEPGAVAAVAAVAAGAAGAAGGRRGASCLTKLLNNYRSHSKVLMLHLGR
jgi:hypothetical protein